MKTIACRSIHTSLLLALCTLVACSEAPEPTAPVPQSNIEESVPIAAPTAAWAAIDTNLQACSEEVQQLGEQLEQLRKNPVDATLSSARSQWLNSHQACYRLLPLIKAAQLHPSTLGKIGQLNRYIDAWPMLPGYVDGVGAYPHSGLVNDITLPINAETLRHQHGFTDDMEVSLGFHALEFLLWGEHGERPVSDFMPSNTGTSPELKTTELPNNRRRTYLILAGNLLIDDQSRLTQKWQQIQPQLAQLPSVTQWVLLKSGLQDALQEWHDQALALQQRANNAQETALDDKLHNAFAGQQLPMLLDSLRFWSNVISTLPEETPVSKELAAVWLPINTQLKQPDNADHIDALLTALTAAQEAAASPETPPD